MSDQRDVFAKELEVTGKMLDGVAGAWAQERAAHDKLRHAVHCAAEMFRQTEDPTALVAAIMAIDREQQKSRVK